MSLFRFCRPVIGSNRIQLWVVAGLFSFLFLGGFVSGLHAQAYDFRKYGQESGLEEGYIYTVVQDAKGFLYLGTGAGLYRFDGAKFKLMGLKDGLAAEFVTASYQDSKGRIWLGHFEGQISILQDMRIHPLANGGSVKSVVYGFKEDKQGNIWGASQSGLFLVDTSGVQQVFKQGLEGRLLHSFAVANVGGTEYCLAGTDQGLLVYQVQGKKLTLLYASTKIPETKLQCIVKLPTRSGFMIGTEDQGLFEFVPSSTDESSIVTIYNTSTKYPELSNVQALMVDNARDLWVGTPDKGFLKYADQAGQSLRAVAPSLRTDSIGDANVRAIYQDRFGQVWMGTYGQGLLSLSDETFSTFHLGTPAGKPAVLCSMEDRMGNLWVGTESGLYVLDREAVAASGGSYTFSGQLDLIAKQKFGVGNGLPSEQITAVLQDANQNIWVGTRSSGVAILQAGENKFVPKSFSGITLSNNINGIIQDKQGNIWIATTDGAYSYDPATGASNFYGTQNRLPHNNIYHIFCDATGKLWFSTHTNRVAVFDGKTFENIEVTHHGETTTVTCVNQTKDGTIWMGTDGSGLYRYADKKFQQFTKRYGMKSNYVYHIVVDHYNNVWTTHREGFSRFINDTGRIIAYPSKNFMAVEENPINGASIDAFGNIWFCSDAGLIRFTWNPTRNKTSSPYIFIHSVQIGDSLWPTDQAISLPYDAYTLRFGFLGLTFLNQEDVMYQYKLEGREQDWSAPTKQDFVTYQALADGEYTFHVRACNGYGRCNEASAKFSFTIAPPFWKTWWFRVLVVLMIVALVYAYIRYRIFKLNREKNELEEKVRLRTVELQAEKAKVEQANLELEKLSLVASETDNAVFILDPAGKLIWVNEGFTRLTGLSMQGLLEARKGEEDFLATSTDSKAKQRMEQAVRTNKSVQYESQLPSTTGETIWVQSTLTPILDKQGNLRNIVIIDSNITERKLAEEKVRQLNADLESQVAARTRELATANESLQIENIEHIKTAEQLKVINSELDTFVYRASHDLKGPLASLIGLINIAGMELGDNAVAVRYLGLMDKASKRLDGILIDLIEATQVKQRTVERIDIDAAALTEQIAESVRQASDMKDAELVLDVPMGMKLHSDETLLTAILQNFLSNALKYRDKSKDIARAKLSITSDAAFVTIAISDNGIGIADDMQHRVFDMFYRGSHQTGGSGLGLYIVKQAAEKLGGTVSLQSKLGEGTTMFAKLPII